MSKFTITPVLTTTGTYQAGITHERGSIRIPEECGTPTEALEVGIAQLPGYEERLAAAARADEADYASAWEKGE